jgi:serine/threonine protein kinase
MFDLCSQILILIFVLQVVNNKNQGYGLPADIWSLGCTVLEMLTRQIPYSELESVSTICGTSLYTIILCCQFFLERFIDNLRLLLLGSHVLALASLCINCLIL